VHVKAIACELPSRLGAPLSRGSVAELGSHVRACGLTASLSDTTIWRWLNEDAIRPWQHRCWIFPRDPDFATKAGRILDLYQRFWKGRKLAPDEFVLSADEKTSIQARSRKAESLPPQPGQPMKARIRAAGAWAYLAALDVHQAKIFGRREAKTGIAPFDRLVHQVMSQQSLSSGTNGLLDRRQRFFASRSPGGPKAPAQLSQPGARSRAGPCQLAQSNRNFFLHPPTQGPDTERFLFLAHELAERLLAFERHYETIAQPFEWRFTRQDLSECYGNWAILRPKPRKYVTEHMKRRTKSTTFGQRRAAFRRRASCRCRCD
jgi:hypothetical protein